MTALMPTYSYLILPSLLHLSTITVLFLRPYSLQRTTLKSGRPGAPGKSDPEAAIPEGKTEKIVEADAPQLAVAPAPGDDVEKQLGSRDDGLTAVRTHDEKTSLAGTDAGTLTNDHEKR